MIHSKAITSDAAIFPGSTCVRMAKCLQKKRAQSVRRCSHLRAKCWSERGDSNSRPLAPEASALPGCATLRPTSAEPVQARCRSADCSARCVIASGRPGRKVRDRPPPQARPAACNHASALVLQGGAMSYGCSPRQAAVELARGQAIPGLGNGAGLRRRTGCLGGAGAVSLVRVKVEQQVERVQERRDQIQQRAEPDAAGDQIILADGEPRQPLEPCRIRG